MFRAMGGPEHTKADQAAAPKVEHGAGGTAEAALAPSAALAHAGGAVARRMLLSVNRLAGNTAARRLAEGARVSVQRQPPPSTTELNDVVDLMPVMGHLDALMAAVIAECAAWRSWRGTLKGPMPGPGAFAAMTQFKGAIRAEGFDWTDERIQAVARRRVTGDDKQLLTEMCSFALGSSTRSGGDYSALAKLCGVDTKALRHKYKLKIGYSVQVKGKIGIGVGYTYRSAAVEYSNDFGMSYNKPLNMRSGGISVGPSAGAKVKGKALELPVTGAAGFEGEGSTESLIFWMPDDFETTFSVAKVAGGGALIGKVEVKVLELVRVSSDKHPALLFDLMGGQTITAEAGAELAAEIGAGVEMELGKMVGGPDIGATTVKSPTLEEAKKNAEKAGLTKPDPKNPDWEVIGATVMNFRTGQAMPTEDSQLVLSKFAAYVRKWAQDNVATDVRFEIVGQASPRWRHPKKGQVPLDLNQKLSQERAEVTKILLQGDWADTDGTKCTMTSSGCPGPEQDMGDDQARATGKGSLAGLAETRDPDNNDAAYRIASITAWGKRAPVPEPPPPPPTIR